jgi:isoleucyl-tRNA synthetase
VAAAIRAADPASLAHAVASDGGTATVEVPSLGSVTLSAEDLVVTQTPLAGWGVATAGGETVALDLAVTGELRAEGYAREVVRLIQDARKSAGLEVSDRIMVRWSASASTSAEGEVEAALEAHGALIAGEVLAVSFGRGSDPGGDAGPGDGGGSGGGAGSGPGSGGSAGSGGGGWHAFADDGLGLQFWLAVAAGG